MLDGIFCLEGRWQVIYNSTIYLLCGQETQQTRRCTGRWSKILQSLARLLPLCLLRLHGTSRQVTSGALPGMAASSPGYKARL